MAEVAESTVAMSLYNAIAGEGAATLAEARAAMARHGLLFSTADLEHALAALLERKLAVKDGERIGVTGHPGHVVVSRDRSDPTGWSGWRVAPWQRRQTLPLVGRT